MNDLTLTSYEVVALIRAHLDTIDPSADRLIALANELRAARERDRKAKSA